MSDCRLKHSNETKRTAIILGVLVFLLALKSVLAEHRWPTVPEITMPLSLRSLKQIRGRFVSAPYSLIPSLPKDTFRRSLKSNNDICAWDPLRKECSLSAAHMLSLVKKSDTELAKIVTKELECAVIKGKYDCYRGDKCLWFRGMDQCEYGNPRIRFNNSACIQAAPLFFDFLEAATICQRPEWSAECEQSEQCQWSFHDEYCRGDFAFVFFGINRLTEKTTYVFYSGKPMLDAEYASLQSSANFTWETLLAYEFSISSIECPSVIEQIVCNFTNTLLGRMWGSHLYCSDKYKSSEAAECTADELCSWHYNTNECAFKGSLYNVAYVEALSVFVDTLPDGIDKNLLKMSFMCISILHKERCNGNCIWNPINKTCEARISSLAALFQAPTEMSNDAVCLFLRVSGLSPCYDKFSESECYKIEFCQWNAEYGCGPNEEYYISAAANEDCKLKQRYKESKKYCSKFKNKETCQVESILHDTRKFMT